MRTIDKQCPGDCSKCTVPQEIPNFDLQKNDDFQLKCPAGCFSSKNLLIACGGMSYPALGGSDIGYRLAKQFGLKIIKPEPALVALDFEQNKSPDLKGLDGISLPVQIKTGKKKYQGDLLFSLHGISGPAVLQTSLFWQSKEFVEIDFLPLLDLLSVLKRRRSKKERKRILSVLSDYLPFRLAERFVSFLPEEYLNVPLSAVSDKVLISLNQNIKSYRFIPPHTRGWAKAEVTKGGVDVNDLFSTSMECRFLPGLFFAGEVVDVTGELGGFNLHWAFASGKAAGQAVGAKQKISQ